MFIFFLKAEQQSLLFDSPVMVEGSVRKDGTVVKPHIRIQKKKLAESSHKQGDLFESKSANPKKSSKLDVFIAK